MLDGESIIVPPHLSPATKLGHGAYRRFSVIIYVYLNKLIIVFLMKHVSLYCLCLFRIQIGVSVKLLAESTYIKKVTVLWQKICYVTLIERNDLFFPLT